MGSECIPMGPAKAEMVWFSMMECVRPPRVYFYGVEASENFLFLADPQVLTKSKQLEEFCQVHSFSIVPCSANSPAVFHRVPHGVMHRASVRRDGRTWPCQAQKGLSVLRFGCASRSWCLGHSWALCCRGTKRNDQLMAKRGVEETQWKEVICHTVDFGLINYKGTNTSY